MSVATQTETDADTTTEARAGATGLATPRGRAEAADPRVRWRPSSAGMIARAAVLAALLLLALAAPHLVPSTMVNIVTRAVVYGVIGLSMNILMGYVGSVSLGHQAFVGVGAFAAGFLITEQGLPWVVAIIGAIVVGGLQSLLLGAIALRVQGFYFAIVTIAYGLFAQEVIFNIRAVTRGGAGMPADRPAFAMGDIPYAYVCMAILALVWLFDWRLTASKAGRAIQALRDDSRVAASWGINVKGYTLLAFVLSGAIAGLGGGLFASIEQIVVSVTFSFTLALTLVLMTVVGGLRSRPGVVIGGIVFATLGSLLEAAHDNLSWWPEWLGAQWEPLIAAGLLLVTLIKYPGGIAEQLAPVIRWLSFGKFHEDQAATVGGGSAGGGMGARP